MKETLKRLEEAEQKIEALSQEKNNVKHTNTDLEARIKELQKIIENDQEIKTILWIGLVSVCVIFLGVIIYRLYITN